MHTDELTPGRIKKRIAARLSRPPDNDIDTPVPLVWRPLRTHNDFQQCLAELSDVIDNEMFLKRAYELILGRPADSGGLSIYLEKLHAECPREVVLYRLATSPEAKERQVEVTTPLRIMLAGVFFQLTRRLQTIPVLSQFLLGLQRLINAPTRQKILMSVQALQKKYLILESDIRQMRNGFERELGRLAESLEETEQKLGEALKVLAENRQAISHLEEYVRNQEAWMSLPNFHYEDMKPYPGLAELLTSLDAPSSKTKLQSEDELYTALEHVLRGSESLISERQADYLSFLHVPGKNAQLAILDVGCGRGEFLSLVKQQGIRIIGLDLNPLYVEDLKSRGYEVYKQGVVEFLSTIPNESLAGITAFQVIEHIPHDYLKEFLRLAFLKLANDGWILLETVNPYCLETFRSFYLDPTHRSPIPKDLLGILLTYFKFTDLRVFYQNPTPRKGAVPNSDMVLHYQTYALMGRK